MSLSLRCRIREDERSFSLSPHGLRIGRGTDNDVVLPDPSVSRHHASVRLEGETFWIVDGGSTNGIFLNGERVSQAPIAAGDVVRVGAFELRAETSSHAAARPQAMAGRAGASPAVALDGILPDAATGGSVGAGQGGLLATGSYIRPLSDFLADYGIEETGTEPSLSLPDQPADPDTAVDLRKQSMEERYSNTIFGYMTRLAGLLLTADSVDEVLTRVTDICAEALPVERGFILLINDEGRAVCELARFGDRVVLRPEEEVPVSKTMLDQVIQKRIALMTLDAQSDERLLSGESIRMHQIRAAMCAPLWSLERIIGVIQVDSPYRTDCFTQRDLDFLVAVANFTAVAVERVRNAAEAERERKLLERLERYHSPAVIDAVILGGETTFQGQLGRLQPAEASVLFADLVGFSAFSETADPEEVARLLSGFFNRAVDAIFAVGGTLDKFIGDCVMAFFGTPLVHADHARRSVEAGIEIQRALARWNAERRADALPPVECRVAINSGPVMVGEVGSRKRVDYTVLGNTVNVAARLDQFVAQPGDVILGVETWRHLEGAVPCEALGALQLKGLTRRVEAFRVDRALWLT